MSAPVIRKFTDADADAVAKILDYFALNTFVSYNSTAVGAEIVKTLLSMSDRYPLYVIEVDGRVVGSGGLRPYHPGDTVRRTGEIGYSFLPEYTGRGLGTILLERLEADARAMGIDTLLGSISSRNEQSIEFHKRRGFVECGRFVRAGRKFDQDFDIVWMQKFL